MATLSFGSLIDHQAPALWDLEEIKKLQLADGTTFDQMVARLSRAMSLLNAELLNLPYVGDMIAVQDQVEVEYPVGVANGVEEATEFGIPTPKRGNTTGHSLPLKQYDRALGWTMMYLRKARAAKLNADVRSSVVDIKSHFAKSTLQQFFRMEAVKVNDTAGASVPLADGGVADANYVPVESPNGESFTSAHDHFLRLDGITQANLETAVETLWEHGHRGPFELLTSQADVGTWSNASVITGFKKPQFGDIIYRASTDRAALSNVDRYIGYVETQLGICRVISTFRIPTTYWGLYQSYGPGDSRNPLRLRIDPNFGFGWKLVPGQYVNAPTLLAVLYAEMGWGTGEDRTNGVLVRNAGSGDYITPTIS